jgi:hypothetical protein
MRATIIAYIIVGVIGIGLCVSFYNDNIYQLDVSKEWLWRARATNDLSDMAKYLNESERILEGFHGNAKWIYQTPDTDFDLIRENIKETIDNALKWSSGNITDMAYQQAVHNLQETIIEITTHFDASKEALYWNVARSPLIGFIVVLCTLWIPMLYIEERWS